MISVVGKKNGFLEVLKSENRKYLVKCSYKDCGTEKWIDARNFYKTQSCGCYYKEVVGLGSITHGHRRGAAQKRPPTEYNTWSSMLQRCTNPNVESFADYGGRGITVCDRWRDKKNGFANFFADMGPNPCPENTINRINNNGNYEPGNCAWATPTEQANNKRSNRLLELNGETKTLSQTANLVGINQLTIHERLARGWTIEEATTIAPVPRPKLTIKVGEKYGHLEVLSETTGPTAHIHYLCLCDCGESAVVRSSRLVNGDITWCQQHCKLRRELEKAQRAAKPKAVKMCSWECGQPAKAKGLCFKHYSHEKRQGNLPINEESSVSGEPVSGDC